MRQNPTFGQWKACGQVAEKLRCVWKRFDIETIAKSSIQRKLRALVLKYKASNKSGNKQKKIKQVNFNNVLDIKKAGFKFLTKEDEILYQQQMKSREGSSTNELINFVPHPSKIRKIDQNSKIIFSARVSTIESDSESSDSYSKGSDTTPPKRAYTRAAEVAKAVNKVQLPANTASKFLKEINAADSSLGIPAPSTSGIYKVCNFLSFYVFFLLFHTL